MRCGSSSILLVHFLGHPVYEKWECHNLHFWNLFRQLKISQFSLFPLQILIHFYEYSCVTFGGKLNNSSRNSNQAAGLIELQFFKLCADDFFRSIISQIPVIQFITMCRPHLENLGRKVFLKTAVELSIAKINLATCLARWTFQIKSNYPSFSAFSKDWPNFLLFIKFVKYAFQTKYRHQVQRRFCEKGLHGWIFGIFS